MTKILFIGDPHYRHRGSIFRSDNFYSTQFLKLNKILQFGSDYKVDAVIFGGDFFHTTRESNELIRDVVLTLKKYNLPVFSPIGNHDVTGRNLESIKSSPLGIVAASGAISLLEKDIEFKNNVVLRGIDYYTIHRDERYQINGYDNWLKIAVTHNMLAPLDNTCPFEFIHPDSVVTNFNIILCAHLHQPFDYISNVMPQRPRFLNTGIPMRFTVDEAKISPKVALLTVDYVDGIHTYNIQYLSLNAKPGYEVFNLQKSAEIKGNEKSIDNFVKALETTSFEGNNLEETLIKYSKDNSIEDKVMNELLKRIKSNRGLYKNG